MPKLLLLLCVAATVASGCATGGYRPHTEREKFWLGQACFGKALDASFTSAAVGSGEFREGNRGFSQFNMEDNGGILAVNAAIISGAYLIGYAFPNARTPMYKAIAFTGYGAATWNAYQMVTH